MEALLVIGLAVLMVLGSKLLYLSIMLRWGDEIDRWFDDKFDRWERRKKQKRMG